MNLTFSLGNFLTAIGIIGALLLVARKIGQWEAKLQATLEKLMETQGDHGKRIHDVEREVGTLMDVHTVAREDMMRIVREGLSQGHQREATG